MLCLKAVWSRVSGLPSLGLGSHLSCETTIGLLG